MSLAQRRTAGEGIDYHHGYGDDNDGGNYSEVENVRAEAEEVTLPGQEEIWRTLSYDAFASREVTQYESFPSGTLANSAPYDVTKVKRVAQVSFAILACVLASGIVCGFAALKPVLIAEGVYKHLCPTGWHGPGPYGDVPCPEQDMRLNLFYVTASITLNVSTVLAGYILDRYGRRVCYLLAASILFFGAMLMGLSFTVVPEDFPLDGYIAGNMFLGLGGTFLFVSSYQLANAFPLHSGLIVAMVTGAFDASAAVFLFYGSLYTATGGTFKPEYFFFGFGVVITSIIVAAEFTLMPPRAYNSLGELERQIGHAQDSSHDVHESDDEIASHDELRRVRGRRAQSRKKRLDVIETVTGDATTRRQYRDAESRRQGISGVWGVLHEQPVSRQMMTPWFFLALALTILQMLRMNYFIATVRAQYRYLLGSEALAAHINHFFDVALPAAGVASTPLIGFLLNNVSVVATLSVLSVLTVVVGTLNCLPYMWTGYVTVVIFVFLRPLYYSAMSDYATKVFGFANFGRIYGAIICVSGLTNFAQPALDFWTQNRMSGDPTPVNVFFAAMGTIVSTALTAYVYYQGKTYAKRDRSSLRGDDCNSERSRLLNSASHVYGT